MSDLLNKVSAAWKEGREEAEDKVWLEAIDSGYNLTEKEIRELLCDKEIDREDGENRRWTHSVYSIVQLRDRFFGILWEEGLTEYQDSEFYNQPEEVEKKTYEKTITVTEWVRKNREE